MSLNAIKAWELRETDKKTESYPGSLGLTAELYQEEAERSKAMGIALGGMSLVVLPPKVEKRKIESRPNSLRKLLLDPYVMAAAAAILASNFAIAVLSPGLSLWMIEKWDSNALDLGLLFLPSSVAYLAGSQVFPMLSVKLGSWLCILVSLPIIATCLATMSLFNSQWGLAAPITVIGLMLSLIETSVLPLMGTLADARQNGVYGIFWHLKLY
ncbi:unnamed protein product, partial [Mesorhabditis spiculigera]